MAVRHCVKLRILAQYNKKQLILVLCGTGMKTLNLQSMSSKEKFKSSMTFTLSCRDLPRGATLCLAVYAVFKKKKKEEKVSVGKCLVCLLSLSLSQ